MVGSTYNKRGKMRKLFSRLLCIVGALAGWQSIMAFLGMGLFFSGVQAGLSLAAFALALFIIGIAMIIPKGE